MNIKKIITTIGKNLNDGNLGIQKYKKKLMITLTRMIFNIRFVKSNYFSILKKGETIVIVNMKTIKRGT